MELNLEKVTILRGISGSGKSTYAKKYLQPHSSIVSADDYFMVDGNYLFDPQKLDKAHSRCFFKFCIDCALGINHIIVDNTNTQIYEMSPYYMVAKKHGYLVEILRFRVNPYIARDRNIHGVPYSAILNQSKNMEDLPSHWPQEVLINT